MYLPSTAYHRRTRSSLTRSWWIVRAARGLRAGGRYYRLWDASQGSQVAVATARGGTDDPHLDSPCSNDHRARANPALRCSRFVPLAARAVGTQLRLPLMASALFPGESFPPSAVAVAGLAVRHDRGQVGAERPATARIGSRAGFRRCPAPNMMWRTGFRLSVGWFTAKKHRDGGRRSRPTGPRLVGLVVGWWHR